MKVELPTELFGKFESTKTEPVVTPVPEQTQNQQLSALSVPAITTIILTAIITHQVNNNPRLPIETCTTAKYGRKCSGSWNAK